MSSNKEGVYPFGNITNCAILQASTTNHGNPDLFCRPSDWTDVVVFFLGNYVAHVATIYSSPGQSFLETIMFSLTALFFPTAGIRKAWETIASRAILADTDLQCAARAGALFVVQKIRTESPGPGNGENGEKLDRRLTTRLQGLFTRLGLQSLCSSRYKNGDEAREVTETPHTPRDPAPIIAVKFHGLCRLPKGYILRCLPKDSTFENDDYKRPERSYIQWCLWPCTSLVHSFRSPRPDLRPKASLSCSYNAIKIVVSMLQLAYACSTLYQTRGDQIQLFGYAAFGLTVAMYAWMSLINLIASLVCPQYPSCFLVESKASDELKARFEDKKDIFIFDGSVGRIKEETEDLLKSSGHDRPLDYWFREAYHWNRNPTRETEESARPDSVELNTAQLVFLPLRRLAEFLFSMRWALLFTCVIVAPVIIIGGMSHFRPNSSARYQRTWTMSWLAFNYFGATMIVLVRVMILRIRSQWSIEQVKYNRSWHRNITGFIAVCIFGIPAIGGFVVVGQMILLFGVCKKV